MAWQHGQRKRFRARATVSCRRMVAIEFSMCRSGRIGGALGVGRLGEERRFAPPGARGGNRRSFADEETISGDAQGCVMMEAAPASPLEMGEAEFAFQFLVIALDAPAQFGRVDQDLDGGVLGQGRKPVFRRLSFALGPFA